MSDTWLLGRARELIAAVQRNPHEQKLQQNDDLDALLAEGQRRGEPVLVGQLYRGTAIARLVTSGLVESAEPLIDEMLAHTRRHGLAILRANAHALRGRRLMYGQQEDAALTEVARALAILDDASASDLDTDSRSASRILSAALLDCWIVINQIGIYEAAEEVITRAHQVVRATAGPHEITLQLLNRIKMLVGWGLRLERVGRAEEAGQKFRTAASMAVAIETPFAESLFPRQTGVPAIEQVGVLAAAVALAAPAAEYVERLRRLQTEGYPHEHVIVTIALARCLHKADRRRHALDILLLAKESLNQDNREPSMRLNLARELAQFAQDEETATGTPVAASTVADYASTLEAELWTLRQSQVATLQARREHERLSAEHGAITQQALQDPLTGLPNRRALDERMRVLASSTAAQPLAIALVDLDGFKDVNDRHSHAEGDDVLRVVAGTLRDALRGDDLIARYGGDEFVVLLPGAPVSAASLALDRAVNAIAELPNHLSHGVTLSIGLVSLGPDEPADRVLSRADAAMYQAKRRGGNQVATATSGMSESVSDWPADSLGADLAATNGSSPAPIDTPEALVADPASDAEDRT